MNSTNLSAPRLPAHVREVTLTGRSVESVFRKLIRMLIGRISPKQLPDMVQVIFVAETGARLKRETPGKNLARAGLALFTGMETRTVKSSEQIDPQSSAQHPGESRADPAGHSALPRRNGQEFQGDADIAGRAQPSAGPICRRNQHVLLRGTTAVRPVRSGRRWRNPA